jgi:hypothetical protein
MPLYYPISRLTRILYCTVFILWSITSSAQLSVAATDTFVVASGETLFVDGLGLTTSSILNLNGISIEKKSTLTNPSLHTAITRAYRFTPAAPSFNGVINFSYTDLELNGINEAQLQLNYFTTIWNTASTNSLNTALNILTTNTVSIQPVEISLASSLQPLPIQWLDVSARWQNNTVAVAWQTANEIQVEKYTIMHSLNGINWEPLGSIAAKGNGANQYQYIHINPANAQHFYRIIENELSGNTNYSKVVSVNRSGNMQPMNLYPNPSSGNDKVVLELSNPSWIQIWQSNGVLIASKYYEAGTHFINTKGITPGYYIITNGQQNLRWVIQ